MRYPLHVTLLICMSTIFVHIIICTTPTTAIKLPPNVTVPALIGFGDSIIDPGNNNNINSIVKANYPPYGQDFKGGIPTGRFSNGRIPTDFLAEEFSIKKYLPAYLDSNLSPEDLLTGVSFASGASGYDPMTSKIPNVISLSEQLEYFKEYIEKVKQLVGVERTNFILTNSVFLVVGGSDDIANTYFTAPFRRFQYDVNSYTDLMVQGATSFIKDLYDLGARRIAVIGVPPIGCVPSQRTLGGGILRECGEDRNEAAKLFNCKLSDEINSLTHKLPKSRVIHIDAYKNFFDIIQNPNKYGFEQVDKGCCGTGLIEVTSLLCNKLDKVCANVSNYLFWDSYHPTERGYLILVSQLVSKFVPLFN